VLTEKPWDIIAAIRLFAGVIGAMAIGFLLTSGVEALGIGTEDQRHFVEMALAGAVFQGGALVWIWIFLKTEDVPCAEAFGFANGRGARVALTGLAVGLAAAPFLIGTQYLCGKLMELLHLAPEPQALVKQLSREEGVGMAEAVVFGILAIVVAPVVEETVFRGILYPAARQCGRRVLFLVEDFADFGSFCARLAQPADAVSGYLKSRLSESAAAALAQGQGSGADFEAAREAVIADLNGVLLCEQVFDAERFAGVELREETRLLAARNPQGDARARLNRLLIEDAFRAELRPARTRLHPAAAMWGVSVLFALFHMNAVSFVPLALFGMILTKLYERTGNLLAPILAHSIFNALNFFLLLHIHELSDWLGVK